MKKNQVSWFLGKQLLACNASQTRPEIHLPSYPGTSKATQVSPGMVRTGPIKVGRFSKSVAASAFDFLQKNAENRLFAVESRVKPPLINTMSDGFQTTNEVFSPPPWMIGRPGSLYFMPPTTLGRRESYLGLPHSYGLSTDAEGRRIFVRHIC